MHAVSVAPPRSPATLERPAPVERAAPQATTTAAADQFARAATELRRWYVFLGLPFVLSALFLMGAIGTGQLWLMGGTLVTGPGLLIGAYIYLAISSDTN
jgi:hypothetical protein